MSRSLFDLSGKVAIVTGASRGLGQYFGRALARAGADLVITSRNADDLTGFKREIASLGRQAFPVALDVTSHDSIHAMVEKAHDHYGRIDILVNNAGCNVRKPSVEITWDDWNLVLDTNLRGTFFTAQAVAGKMIPNGYGRIINIGSLLRQPRGRQAAHHVPGRRLGPLRHYGELPGAGMVQNRTEQNHV